MAKVTLNNGDSGNTFRTNLNAMLTELYAGDGGFKEVVARGDGTPGTGDPLTLTTITHDITASGYSAAPTVIIIPKSDWHVYIISVTTTTITVGVGSNGSGTTLDYDLALFPTP